MMKRPVEDQALETLALHELVGQSDMTLGELITCYKQSPRKNLQLRALAELTLLPEEKIVELLLANGVRQQELPRARKPKAAREATPENFSGGGVDEAPPEPEPAAPQPPPLLDGVRVLVDRRIALAAELGEIDAQLDEIRRLLNMKGENRG